MRRFYPGGTACGHHDHRNPDGALIIPAVNMVREQAGKPVLEQSKEIGKAILAYEIAKNHLPGVMNR